MLGKGLGHFNGVGLACVVQAAVRSVRLFGRAAGASEESGPGLDV